ncbi:unnamed protein product [Phytophthora fragariaefolia]|uniref:Unnamed protein product n=1 Tax=Phytophthora fragariaefolia TaxID=1490495 RepID=A0A9W7D731_9STRA|nr:unnamed protein product [Phytophthora fragariaefolia]
MKQQEGKPKGEYLLLRKLEDIENRLMLLLDDYLKEPDLEEVECYSAFGNPGGGGGVTTGMNVLDMVIAMVFGRLPRDFSQQTTTEVHFQMLFDHHIHILRLWKKDFGRLPPKSRVAPPKADGSDAASAASAHELSDEERGGSDAFEDELLEQAEEFSSYCRVDDSDAFGSDEPTASVRLEDDWESLEVEEKSRSYDSSDDRYDTRDNDSDGYGADFDSDESEDEDELAEVAATHQKLEVSKPPKEATKLSAPARPRRRRIKHTRRSKKLEKAKVERRDSDAEQDAMPFQPFACTGAVGLLRLAKENEMF